MHEMLRELSKSRNFIIMVLLSPAYIRIGCFLLHYSLKLNVFLCRYFTDEEIVLKYSIIQEHRGGGGCELRDGHSTKAENKDERSSEVTKLKIVKIEYYSGIKSHVAGRDGPSMSN